jgi:hypothetical protein
MDIDEPVILIWPTAREGGLRRIDSTYRNC